MFPNSQEGQTPEQVLNAIYDLARDYNNNCSDGSELEVTQRLAYLRGLARELGISDEVIGQTWFAD